MITTLAVYGFIGILVLALIGYLLKDAWIQLMPDKMRVFVADNSREVRKYYVTIHENRVTVGEHTYAVDPSRIYRMGMFRVPTSFYVQGAFEPIDMLRHKSNSNISSQEFNNAVRQHVVKDMIEAFKEPTIPPEVGFSIGIILVLAGLGWIYYEFSQKLDQILQALS